MRSRDPESNAKVTVMSALFPSLSPGFSVDLFDFLSKCFPVHPSSRPVLISLWLHKVEPTASPGRAVSFP